MQSNHAIPRFGLSAAGLMLSGASGCLLLPQLSPWPLAALCLLLGVAMWWRGIRLRLLGPLLVGFGWTSLHAAFVLSGQLPQDWEKQDLKIEGQVIDLPQPQARRTRFL